MTVKRIIFFILGWLCFVTGIVGILVPVLPTTPFLLLATFLFANSSPRFHAWIQRTRVYRRYVVPFKESGGIPLGQKIRILLVSFAIMGVSAWAVPRVFVWVILAAVALWLLYLMLIRIPTIPKNQE
jgi:uncharacterized membrane protein YbaN (DUF454 family)